MKLSYSDKPWIDALETFGELVAIAAVLFIVIAGAGFVRLLMTSHLPFGF